MQLKNVEDYLPLVYNIASKIYKRIPDYSNIEYEELIGYGLLGLAEALNKYKDDKGVKFSTFAYPYIQGRIMDFLRKLNKERAIPEEEKISIDSVIENSIEEDKIDFLGSKKLDPSLHVEREELMNIITEIIEKELAELEKLVLYLWFKEGLSQKEIAKVLEISDSRVSQIKKQSLRKIQKSLKERKIVSGV